MRFLSLILLFIVTTLSAVNIKSHNIYDRLDRVDLMLTFDEVYDVPMTQISSENGIKIVLVGLNCEGVIKKELSGNVIEKIEITPLDKLVEIAFISKKKIEIEASKSADGYGFRLRAIPVVDNNNTAIATTTTKPEPQKNSSMELVDSLKNEFKDIKVADFDYQTYLIVLSILILVLVIFFLLKNRDGNWLNKQAKLEKELKVLFQKPLDPKNRVVMLEYKNMQYLAIIGTTNFLLDKAYKDEEELITQPNKITKPSKAKPEFEELLAEDKDKLNKFFKMK